MFVRVKSTPNSPRKSVQIVKSTRANGKVSQSIVKHVGIAADDAELEELKALANLIMDKMRFDSFGGTLFGDDDNFANANIVDCTNDVQDNSCFSNSPHYSSNDDDFNVNIRDLSEDSRIINGIHDVYGKLFDELGLSRVFANPKRNVGSVALFKEMVLARIANPQSKKESASFLDKEFGRKLSLDGIYRMMDKLDDSAIAKLKCIAHDRTRELFGGKVDVIFFDVTTIYFEAFCEDDLRRNGYSKDLKFNQPQVLLALMVTKDGLPIGYQAFSGDTYEGHTLIPSLNELKAQYSLDKVVYVADSGMLNKDNLAEMDLLEAQDFKYIVGARIKSLSKALQEQITNLAHYQPLAGNEDIKVANFEHEGRKLIVTYSAKRAKKDKADRDKAIAKLRKKLQKHSSPKDYLSNSGNKKFLLVEGTGIIKLNEEKITEHAKWDGLKGIITNGNSEFSDEQNLNFYQNLWQVEESFRITKHDLKIRPVYHYKPQRVQAHLAISFAAYMLVRHLEYRIRLRYKKLSPQTIKKALLSAQTTIIDNPMKRIKYAMPSKVETHTVKIYQVMDIKRKTTPYIYKKY